MRILILGGDGMLGHRVALHLAERHNIALTLRGDTVPAQLSTQRCFPSVDIRDIARVTGIVAAFRPDAIVNCTGLVKQRPLGQDVVATAAVNSIAPHQLAELSRVAGARFLQISTDCVFSGKRGFYTEEDTPDPVDVYGMTKLLGEVSAPGCTTLRTSIIGRELKNRQGLLEWFLAQTGPVKGFRNAVFSGLTTVELARVIEVIVTGPADAAGLYHVSAAPISKHDLLHLLARHYEHPIPIIADESTAIDRSLDSRRFREIFGYRPPDWDDMLRQACEEENKTWR